jgi:hypothetical protein
VKKRASARFFYFAKILPEQVSSPNAKSEQSHVAHANVRLTP